jgi:uncharacterized protein (DUF433 family)
MIRDSGITLWQVYRWLAWEGRPEDEILREHPGLTPENLNAAREYAANIIKSRTHDEFTGRPILPKDRLTHGDYYLGAAETPRLRDGTPIRIVSTIGVRSSTRYLLRRSCTRPTKRSRGGTCSMWSSHYCSTRRPVVLKHSNVAARFPNGVLPA